MNEVLEEMIGEFFEQFAKSYKYDTRKEEGEFVKASTQKAYVAFKDGFIACRNCGLFQYGLHQVAETPS